VPYALVRHHDKASLGAGTATYYGHFHASRLQFIMRHFGTSYFISQVQPVESTWLANIVSSEEQTGLRQAYKTMLERVGRMRTELTFEDDDIQAELMAALSELRQQVYANYKTDALPLPNESIRSEGNLPDHWWEVQDYTFTSSVPLVGPLIAWFRTLWSSISTKWYVWSIRQQQNKVNHILVKRSEIQGQILRDLDRDQTRLTTQLVETIYRLDKIESRLVNLEQQHEKK
jgi:hypothetical protein